MAKNSSPMDAIALLKADHRKVEELFAKFCSARSGKKEDIAHKICEELIIHTMIEEEIFYPACQEAIDDEDLLEEAFVEHDGAKLLIAEILAGSPDEEFYDAKVTVLCEQIKHHVKEEEKRGEGVFAKAREAEMDLDELGARMQQRKEEIKQEIARDGLPTPITRSLKGAKVEIGKPVHA